MTDSIIDALIVGAGPYGLSIGAYAKYLGLDIRIIGRPMQFWDEHVPEGVLLKSEPFASALGAPATGLSFLDYTHDLGATWAPIGQPIPAKRFAAYGQWFSRRTAPEVEDAWAARIDPDGPRYRVTLSTGEEAAARNVVVATGIQAFAHTPTVLDALPPMLASHSCAHRDLNRFAGQEVIVVGAGQSALETAALLVEAGARATLVTHRSRLQWNPPPPVTGRSPRDLLRGPQSRLGTGWRTWIWSERPQIVRLLPQQTRRRILRSALGPAGAWWLKDRLRPVRLRLAHRVTAAVPLGDRVRIVLSDRHGRHQILLADHVIAATGYVPDLQRLSVLPTGLVQRLRTIDRSPVLSGGLESSLPGLYFAGLSAAATFGPVMRFVHGADFAARRIAHHMASTTSGMPRSEIGFRGQENVIPG